MSLPAESEAGGGISVVLPAFNEAGNLAAVVTELLPVLEQLDALHEVVIVDDGSTDGSWGVISDLCVEHPAVIGLRMRRNVGKSTALAAGLASVRGSVVVLMDADGQDNPAEIPRLLAAMEGGLDLVTGRRVVRNDRLVKRSTSRLFNRVTSRVGGVDGRDFNSGFKLMRRQVADSLELYGELHRYIPVLAHWRGFRVGELDVDHRTRLSGRSKFGHSRFWRGFLDLITVRFLTSYANRPLHLFGGAGFLFSAAGALLLVWLLLEQQIQGVAIGKRPALIAGVLLVIVGIQLLSLGLIAQLLLHVSTRHDPRAWIAHRVPGGSASDSALPSPWLTAPSADEVRQPVHL